MENNTASTPIPHEPILTGIQTCMQVDGHALFSANPGVPVEMALEQAGIILDCIETLVLSRDSLDEQVHTTTLQYLTDMVRALVNASYEGICAREQRLVNPAA